MFDLDLTGLRINQLRLIHSKQFRGLKFLKTRKLHENNEDLTSEKNVIAEYLVEKCEMDYTYFNLYQILSVLSVCLIVLLMLTINPVIWVSLGLFGLSSVFYILSMKRKHEFVMGGVGVDMVEEYYNDKIKKKFNL